MNVRLQTLLLCTALPLLAACSGLLESGQPAKQYYMLTPVQLPPSNEADGNQALTLSVSAVPGLDTDRIQALGSDAALNRYANARWPDHLPEVVGSVLKRSLATTGRYSAIQIAPHAPSGSWQAVLEIQQFYGTISGAGQTSSVQTALAGEIRCGEVREPLNLSSRQTVAGDSLAAVVAAHQAGLDAATRELAQILEDSCG